LSLEAVDLIASRDEIGECFGRGSFYWLLHLLLLGSGIGRLMCGSTPEHDGLQ
jgi:hypothetical protein